MWSCVDVSTSIFLVIWQPAPRSYAAISASHELGILVVSSCPLFIQQIKRLSIETTDDSLFALFVLFCELSFRIFRACASARLRACSSTVISSTSSLWNTAKFLQSRQPLVFFIESMMSEYVLGWLSLRQRLGRASMGTGIIIASILGSASPGHGGNLDMLSLDVVLDREPALP